MPGSPKGKSLRDNCGGFVLPAFIRGHPLCRCRGTSPRGGSEESALLPCRIHPPERKTFRGVDFFCVWGVAKWKQERGRRHGAA